MRKWFTFLSVLVGLVMIFSSAVTVAFAKNPDKVTICHASGQAGTTKFQTLTIGWMAVFGPAGHFFENGTPRAGHEDDYLGACTVTPDDISGCINPLATNYNPAATIDDGSCEFPPDEVLGCTNSLASNYNPAATIDDGSCEFPPDEVPGCTNPLASNYNPAATVDDGSCTEVPPVTPVPTQKPPRSCADVYQELSSRNNPNIWTSDSALPVWFANHCQYYKPKAPVSGGGSGSATTLMLAGLALLSVGLGSFFLFGKKTQ